MLHQEKYVLTRNILFLARQTIGLGSGRTASIALLTSGGRHGERHLGIAGLDWQQRVNKGLDEEVLTERAREMMKARPRRHALQTTRTCAISPARWLGWNRSSRACATPLAATALILFEQGDRLSDRAALADPKENVRHLRLDQGRGRITDPAGDQVHQGGAAGDEGERRRRAEFSSISSTST
jgi:hypothetical protein